jgi:hypothetical protein
MGREAKHIVVRLTAEERLRLEALIHNGGYSASVLKRAQVLLQADEAGPAWSDKRISEVAQAALSLVKRVRQRFVFEGLEAAVFRKPAGRRSRRLDEDGEAHLVALALSQPPAGRSRWTLQLLADKLVALQVVKEISYESVRRTLKKMSSGSFDNKNGSPHKSQMPTLWREWKTI